MPRTIFRVFFSSTFGDFQAEREKLRAEVWPRLEALCASHGASFHVVDLRWGISPSVATTHDTIQICLDEVKRCQELSPFPKPNFLMLIGDRYGWRPPAVEIPDADFQVIKKAASKDDAAFLASWYRKDENAVPPVWLLKPREGEYQDYNAWGPVENRLVSIQHDVSEKLNLSPEKYLYSATHMEIVDGLLKLEGVQDHIFTCNRELKGLPAPAPKGIARRFADYLPDGTRDPEAESLLSVLKEQITAVLPDSQIHLYSADWLGDEAQPISTGHLEQLCADVEASLLSVIRPELDQMAATTPLQEELEVQRQFLAETGRLLIGRDKELNKIRTYLGKKKTPYPLIIQATGGCGKSALMAKAVMEQEEATGLIYRFIGASPRSWQPQSFLEDLIIQIAQTFGQETPTFPEEGGIKALGELLNEQLQLATEEQPLTIFIDAIDQFSSTSAVQYRDIFPEELPDNVRMVISVLNGKDADQLNALYPKSPRINLAPLSPSACGKILDALLDNRKLNKEQRTAILDKAKESGLPLWLTLAAPIAIKIKSWDTAPDLPSDIKELARYVVKRIADKHGPAITTASIRYIKLARYGLSETELQEILWADPEVKAEFNSTKNPDQPEVTELPPIFWSRLYAELDPYINEYWMDGQLLHRYFHRVFGEVADEMEEETRKELHSRLAEYFKQQPLYLEQQPNGRKLMELPYHLSLADRIQEARDTITDFDFAMAKCRLNRSDDWVNDFFKASAAAKSREYRIWESFAKTNAHILRRGNADWPAHKILLQLAIEHADDSPATIGAEKFLEEGKCDWGWLRRELRVEHAGIDPCLAVFEGHTDTVNGALQMPDGRILSWSDDRTIRLWSMKDGICLKVLEGHNYRVGGVELLPNANFMSFGGRQGNLNYLERNEYGQMVLFSSKECDVRIWDNSGELLKVFSDGHNGINRSMILNNYIVSWSPNHTISVWNNKGNLINKLVGHKDSINGILSLSPEEIISWSDDKTIRLWNIHNNELKIFVGHAEPIVGVLAIDEKKILSWGSDSTIRLWDCNGNTLKVEKCYRPTPLPKIYDISGNESNEVDVSVFDCRGAMLLANGNLLIWGDEFIQIWSNNLELLKTSHQHTSYINGALLLNNSVFLTWSDDHTICSWSFDGNCLNVFSGHTGEIYGVHKLSNGNILSWSSDNTIKLWTDQGVCIKTLEGHTSSIEGVIQLYDNLLLSWARDKSLRLWNIAESDCLSKLHSHKGMVNGALVLPCGNIMTGDDDDLYIWDCDGKLQDTFHKYGLTNYNNRLNSVYSRNGIELKSIFAVTQLIIKNDFALHWHASSECTVRDLFKDERALVTQANGQVCLLRLWLGNRRVTLAELQFSNTAV